MEILELFKNLPDQLNRMPLALLVMSASIIIGLFLRRAEFFPNKHIPLMVLSINTFLYWLMGDVRKISPEIQHPNVALALYGIVYGFIGWGCHTYLIKKLTQRFPGFDTDFLRKTNGKPKPDPPRPDPPIDSI